MCGIVGAIAQANVIDILLEGLRRLEYRGYDSAGVAVLKNNEITRVRSLGKVSKLIEECQLKDLSGSIGIAHTRWATHGVPSENNAHPLLAGPLAIVHNGIIENYLELKEQLLKEGEIFESETDTEVFVKVINKNLKSSTSLLEAIQKTLKTVRGAYGTVLINKNDPTSLITARSGSPIVIGIGNDANYIASDPFALLPVTRKFIYLEEGDIAQVTCSSVTIYDRSGNRVERSIMLSEVSNDDNDKGKYRHFMQKEIHEQSEVIKNTLKDRILNQSIVIESFGSNAKEVFKKIENIKMVACGTSYHACLIAKQWFEEWLGISTDVEIASEFRYRKTVTRKNSLFITLSQSGETADTLAALKLSKEIGYLSSLTICNVQDSSLVRESELSFLTKAGKEIGVASTKAFTTQLVSLLLLLGAIGVVKNILTKEQEQQLILKLNQISEAIRDVLTLDPIIQQLSLDFVNKHNSLFLGRGSLYPVAMEGALKLKEISYIHAEAYAAGELKHGPLALIDSEMPVIVVAPKNDLLEKLKSNIQEVRARGGILYVFKGKNTGFKEDKNVRLIEIPEVDDLIAPIIYTIPLQLLSYHVAIIKGTDVDQPRNLAKSVTVE
jgi:glucosamine--fructose-6-phosphate aminotransferase (isomerizing)